MTWTGLTLVTPTACAVGGCHGGPGLEMKLSALVGVLNALGFHILQGDGLLVVATIVVKAVMSWHGQRERKGKKR